MTIDKCVLMFVLCQLISTVTACQNNVDKKLIVGKYCLNRESGRDSLFVRSNGSYTHSYFSSSGRTFESTGKWKLDERNAELLFEDFVFFNDSGAGELPPGNWYSRVRQDESGVKLMYSSESDIYFLKAR